MAFDEATPSVWLDTAQPGCVLNAADGFCSCATDWTPVGDGTC